MKDDQEMDALIATAFQVTGEPTEALAERLDALRREYERRRTPANTKERRMKHAALLAAIIAASLLGMGALSSVVYKLMHGDLIQNGKKVGSFHPSQKFPGVIEINSDRDKIQSGPVEMRKSDGGSAGTLYVETGK